MAGVVDTGDKFFAGVVDTAEQLFAGVVYTSDKHYFGNISANFRKNSKRPQREYLWAWGTLIHEKNLSSKTSCQTPFKVSFGMGLPLLYKVSSLCFH